MSGLFRFSRKHKRVDRSAGIDGLASLIISAREDAVFRQRLLCVLRLPTSQREPLIRTAVDEMRLRGEPTSAQAAFAILSTDKGALTALHILEAE